MMRDRPVGLTENKRWRLGFTGHRSFRAHQKLRLLQGVRFFDMVSQTPAAPDVLIVTTNVIACETSIPFRFKA